MDIGSMNPQQLQFLVSLLSRGGQQQGLPGLPGLPGQAPGLSPQQALMQQLQNPQPSAMQQILVKLQEIQQLQGQQAQPGQNNPLLAQQMGPQQQALMQALMQGRGAQQQPQAPWQAQFMQQPQAKP
jgi:hypothetical protein